MFWIIEYIVYGYFILSLGTFLIPQMIQWWVWKPQNLKRKYNAEWAVVTGGSSGIGLAIVERLAEQGINVFVVALPDKDLEDSVAKLRSKYPAVRFESVGANLAQVDEAVAEISQRTQDYPVSLLFNNAGYLKMFLYSDAPLGAVMANYNVNLTTAVRLTHLFASRMVADPKITRGAITFTSSPAGMMPNPFAATYGCTKAGLTALATSIAPELRADGIDVLVVHPSPVDTKFYTEEATRTSSALAMFRKTATTPQLIADCFFSQLGRAVVYDQGYFPLLLRLTFKVLDFNLFALLTTVFGRFSAEAKTFRALRK